jgi:hypothetical protein
MTVRMLGAVAIAISAMAGLAEPAEGRRAPREAWSVTRTTDPITGASTCVVAAFDQIGRSRFSRVGALYPVVENNARLGLLVGVSSGGQFRLPTGDIVWRVDDRPHRELKAADNPATGAALPVPFKTGNEAADRAAEQAMAQQGSLIASMTATSTVASGERAREMLAEMAGAQSLIFRQSHAAPAYGLPSSQASRVGQYTSKGLRPIPLDASFRRGLTECGIGLPAASPEPVTQP